MESLNNILDTGKRIMKIGYFMAVVCLILLATYLIKEWKILSLLGRLLLVISPIFIGIIIAWLFDPLVDWFEKRVPRAVGCIFVYLIILGGIFLFFYLLAPNFVGQVKDFASTVPDILKDLVKFSNGFIDGLEKTFNYDLGDAKKQIYASLTDFGIKFTTNLPTYIMNIGKSLLPTAEAIVFLPNPFVPFVVFTFVILLSLALSNVAYEVASFPIIALVMS